MYSASEYCIPSYLPYGASAILHYRSNTADLRYPPNPSHIYGKKILYRISTSIYLRLPPWTHKGWGWVPRRLPPSAFLPPVYLSSTSLPPLFRLSTSRLPSLPPAYLSASRLSLYPLLPYHRAIHSSLNAALRIASCLGMINLREWIMPINWLPV